MRLLLLLAVLPALVFAEPISQKQYDALAADKALSNSERLRQLFALDWEHGIQQSPEFATSVGYPGLDGIWTDMSEAAIARRQQEQQWPLSVLKSIDRSKLSPDDQLYYDLYRRDLEQSIAGNQFPGELMAVSQLGGVQRDIPDTLIQMPRENVKQYENILSRMRGAPVVIEQNLALLKRGLATGLTAPKIVLRDVPKQVEADIPEDPLKSPLLRPFTEFPEGIPAADGERLRAEAIKIYREQLVPAFQGYLKFLTEDYIPHARETIALHDLPNGENWYAFSVRASTTTSMSPKEIHELGLSEVKRIRAEMEKVMTEAKFQGSFEDFMKFLRSDPQFYYTKPEDLLIGYRDIAKRIDATLPRFFGKLPRLPYGVKPAPAYNEKSQPAAYYESGSEKAGRPGFFVANTYNLPGRPKWEMECLTLHEAVPGHHLQISLAQEMENVPEFRKYQGNTAYVEGWALYCEGLGSEMGFYQDPYSKFGRLTLEMWRAVRLVVDTGLHEFGWSREQAIKYLSENTGKSEYDATVEIDRYIVWPGQALAYKIGQLKIQELRAYAEKELGDHFDIRAFHDELLSRGALPLDLLETMMKDWVAAQKAKFTEKKS
ncbi:DUF885 domain-containing protein [soil metagenome]